MRVINVYISFHHHINLQIFSLFMNDCNDCCVLGNSIKHIDNEILSQFLQRLPSSRSRRPKCSFLQVIDLKDLWIDESDKRVDIIPYRRYRRIILFINLCRFPLIRQILHHSERLLVFVNILIV